MVIILLICHSINAQAPWRYIFFWAAPVYISTVLRSFPLGVLIIDDLCVYNKSEWNVCDRKHDLYQTLMRLLLINSRCRSALTQDFGIIRFQIVKGKNLY